MKTLALFFLMAVSGLAQTAFQPQYYVGTGATYAYYGHSGSANVEIGIHATGVMYSWTTVAMAPGGATLRSGAAFLIKQSGFWSLAALADAGVATSSTATLANFSGGGLLFYDVGARASKNASHFYVGLGVRVESVAGAVQPQFEITFGKGL